MRTVPEVSAMTIIDNLSGWELGFVLWIAATFITSIGMFWLMFNAPTEDESNDAE